jgi:hypothetical protein
MSTSMEDSLEPLATPRIAFNSRKWKGLFWEGGGRGSVPPFCTFAQLCMLQIREQGILGSLDLNPGNLSNRTIRRCRNQIRLHICLSNLSAPLSESQSHLSSSVEPPSSLGFQHEALFYVILFPPQPKTSQCCKGCKPGLFACWLKD